ncbi:MAG: radical SAM/SPASM domain-containing protein [Patescibacteria group bacterium]
MNSKSILGLSPEYLRALHNAAGRYLGLGTPSKALRRGALNILATYSPSALHRRAKIRRSWGFAPESYTVSVTNACNLCCGYCYYGAGGPTEKDIVHIDLEKLGVIFREMKEKFGIRFVTLTGGETTLHVREIAARWPDITFYTYTNGKLLSAEFCQELEELGNVVIVLTVIGTEATHEGIRPGNYAHVMAAVENLQRTSLVWGFSVTESRINFREIVEGGLLDSLLRFEPFGFRMIPFMPVGREQANWALTPEEHAQITTVIQRKKKEGALIHDYINDPAFGYGCMAGGVRSFLITERLELSPCVFMDTLTPPLEFRNGSSNLMEVLQEHPYFRRARELVTRFPRCIILENSSWREEIVR